ncbi:MAG: hypothetical protein WC795_01735 [Candidatus Paceibacterota bacterium]|jgi:hypothetical protein
MIENPIAAPSLSEFVKSVLDVVLTIGIPVVALFIIYSGFLFVKARGNEKELTTAKDTLMWTLVGAAILLGSWVLASAIGGTITELQKP